MRSVIQRVISASVAIDGNVVASIGAGVLVLAGFHTVDTEKDIDYMISKILGARIFDDENGVMNLSVSETGGDVLLVSQFTLYGDLRKGRRPSYSDAMPPEKASVFYTAFVDRFREQYGRVQTGVFRADMKVSLVNSGPVTILIDSAKTF
jgi:D-tyrosyl-tRNA(Tyr) deacylase